MSKTFYFVWKWNVYVANSKSKIPLIINNTGFTELSPQLFLWLPILTFIFMWEKMSYTPPVRAVQ